jgi:hypothetical protein
MEGHDIPALFGQNSAVHPVLDPLQRGRRRALHVRQAQPPQLSVSQYLREAYDSDWEPETPGRLSHAPPLFAPLRLVLHITV